MILFPRAKINLGLHILGKREDGYHELDSILYPIGLSDVLEVVPDSEREAPELSISGTEEEIGTKENLVWKAFFALPSSERKQAARIHLHKEIPSGAGLGGGSSDAAHLLRYYADTKGMDPFDPSDPWSKRAASLGSDVPFFLQDGPARVSGRGEELQPCPLDLGGWTLLLRIPPFSIGTANAYKEARGTKSPPIPPDFHLHPVEEWTSFLWNDLEKAVFKKHPELMEGVDKLRQMGASYASMTGSGSGIFGLFREEPEASGLPENWLEWRECLPPLTSAHSNK